MVFLFKKNLHDYNLIKRKAMVRPNTKILAFPSASQSRLQILQHGMLQEHAPVRKLGLNLPELTTIIKLRYFYFFLLCNVYMLLFSRNVNKHSSTLPFHHYDSLTKIFWSITRYKVKKINSMDNVIADKAQDNDFAWKRPMYM